MHPTVTTVTTAAPAASPTDTASAGGAASDPRSGDRLRTLRASTMIRLTADRLHRGYAAGTLDPRDGAAVERAIVSAGRADAATSDERLDALFAAATADLADALDADDHVAGQFTVTFAGAALAAMAIRRDLEVGALSPF